MTTPDNLEPVKADVHQVVKEFEEKKKLLEHLCKRTQDLIDASLKAAGIRYQSIQTRVKDSKKLEEKYLDPKKDYRSLNDITDQAGIRIITYYADDVDRVKNVIQKEFQVDPKHSIDKRETEPDRFGYSAINYV